MQNLVDFYTSFEGLNIQTFAQESKLNFFPQNFSVKFYIQTVSHRLSLPLLQKQVKLQQNNGRPSSLAIVFGPLKWFNIIENIILKVAGSYVTQFSVRSLQAIFSGIKKSQKKFKKSKITWFAEYKICCLFYSVLVDFMQYQVDTQFTISKQQLYSITD
ncbi:Hypothetical_protein [Hexamita inflata]|uniref:Hypothetical_protein n=1 Tax=Hexamita inflata TaxID=28002 RepID=A0AA86QWS9_9EUKA|nr:Hypothetical protein HINF_LOCUS52302 [Hexamita inflata]